MDTYFTITYNGVEQTLAQLGVSEPKQSVNNQGRSFFTVTVSGTDSLLQDPPVPYWGQVVVTKYPLGDATKKVIIFQGRQVTNRIVANQSPERILTFADAFHDLANTVFQQQWKFKQPVGGGTVTTLPTCRVNLFQELWEEVSQPPVSSSLLITVGQQIQEILNWAITCGVQIQVGNVNVPWLLNVFQAKGLTCEAAIQLCLKPVPDAVCWLDYSTVPPTFNVTQRAGATAVTLPWQDGKTHRSSDIQARYDLVPPQVVLQYAKVVTVNGKANNEFVADSYPVGSTGAVTGALVAPLELGGAELSSVQQQVTSLAFDPTDLEWWKQKKPEFANTARYTNLAIVANTATVTDTFGSVATVVAGDVTSDPDGLLSLFPYEFQSGNVAPWMPVGTQVVTVQAQFSYTELDSKGQPKAGTSQDGHPVSVRVKLTNSLPGVQTYSATSSADPGESPIAGLAQLIWQTMNVLPYEGKHQVYEENILGKPEVGAVLSGMPGFPHGWNGIVGPQFVLNLSGGRAEWASMKVTIQSVEIDHFRGFTDISFGPPKHVAPAELAEMLQFYRWRWTYRNPSTRQTGTDVSQSSSVDGGDTLLENTTQGNPGLALDRVAGTPF